MVVAVSASGSPAHTSRRTTATRLEQIHAMAHLAHETGLVVHVVVAREPGVVEYARQVARELGVECSADLRARSVRVRFGPSHVG
jgi:hypothetical protein